MFWIYGCHANQPSSLKFSKWKISHNQKSLNKYKISDILFGHLCLPLIRFLLFFFIIIISNVLVSFVDI